ncbi:hypothetical protein F4780DRAFT_760903 [Xylariomycetidae sp. FL0641]|nr:hypothetical protein F4780DRAFT_760903 [Xylariomycetidae sp. FL0641]
MSVERSAFLETRTSIKDLIDQLGTAGELPADVGRCLDLVHWLCRDTQHLIELRDESAARLEAQLTELFTINYAITAATQNLEDIDGFLLKYKRMALVCNASPYIQMQWAPEDVTGIAGRLTHLREQHQAVTTEINKLKTPSATGMSSSATPTSEKRFENVRLLHALFGNNRRLSTCPFAGKEKVPVPVPLPRAEDSDELGESQRPEQGSRASEKSVSTETPPQRDGINDVQSEDPASSPASSMLSVTAAPPTTAERGLPLRAHSSSEAEPPGPSRAPTARPPRAHTPTNPSLGSGLHALFQQPVRLGSAPDPQAAAADSGRLPAPPPVEARQPDVASVRSSIPSLVSPSPSSSSSSAGSSHRRASSYDHPRPAPAGLDTRPRRKGLWGLRGHARNRSSPPPPPPVVFRPRLVSKASDPEEHGAVYELEGSPLVVVVAKPTQVHIVAPDSASSSSSRRSSRQLPPPTEEEEEEKPRPRSVAVHGRQVLPGGARRMDSEAWQRRTRVFQIEDPDGHLRVRRQ